MHTALLHELPYAAARSAPEALALTCGAQSLTYNELALQISALASGLMRLRLQRGERIAIYLDKRFETVIAAFGASAAGGVFVPINPLLKPAQVAHILRDSNARILFTSRQRYDALASTLAECEELSDVVLTGERESATPARYAVHAWSELCSGTSHLHGHRVIDADVAAILYTSGSTGKPKGVVLSHRNMVAGAKSVVQYLQNTREDTLLAALPLSFDAGFSQLTTAFHVGGRVVLLNYLLPRELVTVLERERVTGLTGVPPLYIQLSQLDWPSSISNHLRYFANTGGRMPLSTLARLRAMLPRTKPFLMYGLTEAFRATCLPPEEIDRRPDSIGKAIPNAEVLVLREDGTRCAPNEPGELVQRGALVAMGYWNDPEATAERFRPLPRLHGVHGSALPEIAVFSGDTVREDEDGFLYFIGRRDEMIKTSGYRVSPIEIEEVVYATQLVGEAVALGVRHPSLGQAIVVIVTPGAASNLQPATVLAACRERLPLYMVPAKVEVRAGPLPRNPNGKIDRRLLARDFEHEFAKG